MKKYILRVVSVLMVVMFLVFLCVPAFAASGFTYEQKVGFWEWASHFPVLKQFAGYATGTVCPKSEDQYHHANSYQVDKGNGYYTCICSYCGQTFTAYESDLKQSYRQQVSDLPAPVYGSDGSIYVLPTILFYNISDSICICTLANGGNYSSEFYSASANLPFLRLEFLKNLYVGSDSKIYGIMLNYDIPFLCSAELLFSSASYSSGIESGNLSFYGGYLGSNYYGTSQNYAANSRFSALLRTDSVRLVRDGSYVLAGSYVQFILRDLRLKLTPNSSSGFDTVYNVNTRPTTITGGNYGIVGDDNQITTVNDNRKIVNEGDNIYYNPATGEEKPITNWSYDYGDRTYEITVEGGDTYTVTYGDENISIVEGDINYTIYYMIDGSGESHTHEWYKTGERQATCLVPAQRTYTCSVCGEQKTETDPVLGHSWHAIKTVTTQYDENGNLTQEGYTIYECERCGEQYKSTNDTGLPPSGGGGSGGGSGSNGGDNIFSGIFGVLWDFCTFFFDFFSSFVVDGIKGFIKGLLDAGSDFFSILNPFDWGY